MAVGLYWLSNCKISLVDFIGNSIYLLAKIIIDKQTTKFLYEISIKLSFLLIPLVNQIHHHLHHHILLLGAALGNHQRKSYEGVVRQALGAVVAVMS